MKGLRQTRLSFTSQSNNDTPKRSGQASSSVTTPNTTDTPVKTPKLRKHSQSTKGRGRSSAMDCVVIPPPPKRILRAQAATRSSSTRLSPVKPLGSSGTGVIAAPPTQPRKPSFKRKLSLAPASDSEDIVHMPAGSSCPSKNTQASFKRSPPKKIRLSSPESDLTPLPSSYMYGTDAEDLVPTSQSDEQELTLPRVPERRDPASVYDNVAKWRKETRDSPPSRTQSPPPLDPILTAFDDVSMDVDTGPIEGMSEMPNAGPMQYPQTPHSASDRSSPQEQPDTVPATVIHPTVPAVSGSQRDTPTWNAAARKDLASLSDTFSTLTPPPSSEAASEPGDDAPIVQALDEQSKTAQLIADIKARAYAAAHSSPEQPTIDLDAISDSDSDSEDEDPRAAIFAAGLKGKGKAKATISPPKADSSKQEPSAAPRYNLRRASPKPPKRVVSTLTQQPAPKKANPLAALLREKKREEQTGKGMAAIRLAEMMRAASKSNEGACSLKGEMDVEEDSENNMDWSSEVAGLGAAARGAKRSKSSRTPSGSTADSKRGVDDGYVSDDERALAGIDCEAILGKKGGKAVGKILEKDLKARKAQALAKLNEEPVGVPLWSPDSTGETRVEGMDVDSSLPPFAVPEGANALLQAFGDAVARNDVAQVSALLASGLVAFLRPGGDYQFVIPWLFDTAFSDASPKLCTLAYTQLMRLAPLVGQQPSGLHSSFVLLALVHLGAPRAVLEERYGWFVPAGGPSKFAFDISQREEMTRRLVSALGAFARPSMGDELRELFFVLLLIGMDPTTSEDMATDIRKSCDNVARALEAAQGETFDLEASLWEKVVPFGKSLSPRNQERLISLFPCISSSTTRIARNVSRSLLLENTPARGYERLADLAPVFDLLTPDLGSGAYFDIPVNTETDTDDFYDDLTSRVSLLSRVLSDIEEYTILELRAAKERAAREHERRLKAQAEGREQKKETKEKEEDKEEEQTSVLDMIRTQLDILHGRIVDTRAAHLDRSRAKAALQRVCLRVHYQRKATLKSGFGTGKPRNLRGYFEGP
ncbi:hypothetical protein BD413DRAFT_585376 [Trametes elegans]|nr:hypothetical protein BD413DRAFT_585376 [Trametes elegans]